MNINIMEIRYYFGIIFLIAILIKRISSDVQLSNNGVQPKSFPLMDDTIATFLTSGYIHNLIQGQLISFNPLENLFEFYQTAHFPDGSFIVYNGFKIYYFSMSLTLINSVLFDSLNIPDSIAYLSVAAINNDNYIISAVINKILFVVLFDKSISLNHVNKREMYPTLVFKNAQCSGRKTEGFFCAYIQDVEKRFLTVIILDKDLIQIDSVDVPTIRGNSVKYKKTIVDTFLICFLNADTNCYCSVFDEKSITLSNPTYIARTGNYDETKIEIGVLSAKELVLVYASNASSEIRIQKINAQGIPKGSILIANIQIPYSQISTINYLIFPKRLHGIVYGLSNSVHFKELNIPYCFDYCMNVEGISKTDFDLDLHSTLNSSIKFISLPSFFSGRIQKGQSNVSTGTLYSPKSFSFFSLSPQAIASAKYVTKNIFGESFECSINIFIGQKGNCKCPENTFSFYDECLNKCPDYTYTDTGSKECINCASNGQYIFEGQCIDKASAPENTYISDKVYNVLSPCAAFCRTCSGKADKCITCVPFDLNCPISCGPGTFYSLILGDCKACYNTCKTCSEEGTGDDHKCNTCKNGYEIYPSSPSKCEKSCSKTSLWYLDDKGHYKCNYSSECPSDRPILIDQTYQCVESCSKISTCVYCQISSHILKRYKNSCVKDCPSGTLPNDKAYLCDKIPNIDIDITDKPLNETIDDLDKPGAVTKPNVTIIKGDNYTIEIYNSTNQGGNLALSQIDFSRCEKILRKQYSIPDGDILIFVKFDLDRNNLNTDQVEYQVRDSKGNILKLKYCENETVDITYQIKNSSLFDVETAKKYEDLGIDIYNAEDPFFTDICFPFSTDNGTDIILRDRLKDIYKNISVCEESCTYKGVDLENMSVTCSCAVKVEVQTEVNMNTFTQSLTSVFTNSNFIVVKCFNLVFDPKVVVKNWGFWFGFVMIVFHIPNWFYYFVIGVSPITKYFTKIPKNPPQKNKDYIDRIISEGNLENRSINKDMSYDSKLKQFKKSQVILSQSHSLMEIITPSPQPVIIESKKSLFTLTKKTVTKQSRNTMISDDDFDLNKNNDNSPDYNRTISSRNMLNQSNRTNSLNIIQYQNNEESDNEFNKYNDNNRDDYNSKSNNSNEENGNPYSVYSVIKDHNNSSFYPKLKLEKERDSVNRSLNSNFVNNTNQCFNSNMSAEIGKACNKLNLSNVNTPKSKKGLFDEKYNVKKGIVSSKFNPITNKFTHSNTNMNSQSNKITALTAMSTMNDSNLKTNHPFNTSEIKLKEKIKPSKEILDDFDLINAQMYDTRSFWRLLWISLKAKHPILATFVMRYHFSLRTIIILNFIFGNLMDFSFNAFFYTDELISNRYHYEGNLGFLFDLQNNIVISIASFAVSLIVGFFLNLLSTSESKLEIVFNSQKTAKHSRLLLRKVIRCLKIKLAFFLIIELLFTLFFWYYITAFCAVYQSSQWSWLSGGITSLLLGLLFPLPIALGIILVRKLAIRKKKNCLFKFSLWVYKL